MTQSSKENSLYSYRWLIYIIVLLLYCTGSFLRLSPGVIKNELEAAFALGAVGFSTLNSMYFYTYMILQIPVGIFVDTIGAKKMVIIGGIITALGAALFGLAGSVPVLMISRLLIGMGTSAFFIAILKLQTQWYLANEYGFMTGLTSFVGNMGGALAQGPLAFIIALASWRITFLSVSGLILLLVIASAFFVVNRPEDKGFAPLHAPANTAPASQIKLGSILLETFKNKKIWPLVLYMFFAPACSFTIIAWGPAFFTETYDVTMLTAGNIMFIQTTVFALSCVAIGKISDLIKRRKLPSVLFAAVNVVIWCVFAFAGNRVSLPVAATLIVISGAANTGYILSLAIAKEISNPEFSGISTSVVNTAPFLGGAVAPIIFGTIIERYTPMLSGIALFQKAFLLLALFYICAFVSSFFLVETGARNIYYD